MIRSLLIAASALALVSGVAMAETYVSEPSAVTITRSTPHDMSANRTITKRYINHRGMMVTKHKSIREGFSGSSVSRTKTVHDPVTGMSRSRTEIER